MRASRAALAAALLVLMALPLGAQEPLRRRLNSPIAFYDDADIAQPGLLNLSSYFSYNRVPVGHDVSVPAVSFTLGLHRRVEIGRAHV